MGVLVEVCTRFFGNIEEEVREGFSEEVIFEELKEEVEYSMGRE